MLHLVSFVIKNKIVFKIESILTKTAFFLQTWWMTFYIKEQTVVHSNWSVIRNHYIDDDATHTYLWMIKQFVVTLLEPPFPKPLFRGLTVSWLEQQGKYIGLKIKKSGCNHDILHRQQVCLWFFSSLQLPGYWKNHRKVYNDPL